MRLGYLPYPDLPVAQVGAGLRFGFVAGLSCRAA